MRKNVKLRHEKILKFSIYLINPDVGLEGALVEYSKSTLSCWLFGDGLSKLTPSSFA